MAVPYCSGAERVRQAGLPLKDDTNAYGTLQPEELYQMFADIAE
jgi:hypothetical protein